MNAINIDKKEIIANDNITLTYSGYLKDSKKVFVHYGLNNWTNTNEVPMKRTVEGFVATISIPADAENIEFAFRNEVNNWDNNFNQNYSYNVCPPTLFVEDTESLLETPFFNTDFLLEYNLNQNFIQNQEMPNQFTLDDKGRVILSSNFKTFADELEERTKSEIERSIENNVFNFEAELNDTLDSNYDKIFMNNLDSRLEANDAFVSSEILEPETDTNIITNEFNFENSDIIEEPIIKTDLTSSTLYFHAAKPYAKLFKESQVQLIQNLIDSIDENTEEINDVSLDMNIEYNENLAIATSKYYTKENTLSALRKLANQNLLSLEVENEKTRTANYLAVTNNSELDPFDNSLLATIIRYKNSLISAFNKLKEFVKDSFSKEF